LDEKQISESEENFIRGDDSNKKKVNQISKGKNSLQEFKYSQCNTINDAYPTPKNLLATVPKPNCIILKQTGGKSRSGATNVMHAEQVLKNNEVIFRNIKPRISSIDPNNVRKLTGGELFSYIIRLKQLLHFFIIKSFRCKTNIYLFIERFHTNKNNEFPRTPVNSTLLFLFQYHETSREIAAEQMGSLLRSVIKSMFKNPFISVL
jgi:hypothetical protein